MSALSFQFVQETMAWERNDHWGRAPLAYAAGAIADESALRARFDEELRRQAPMRPWSALPPSARPLLDGIDGEVGLDDVSASGLVIDGALYVRGCHLSFWSTPYRTSAGCFVQIPVMLGYGGNLVALLPNGVSVSGSPTPAAPTSSR